MVRDRRAVVVFAVGARRPAVIAAFLDEVQLVAACRTVLDLPQPAIGIEIHGENVAVAPTPDLVAGRSAIRERIACGGRSVEIEPHDGAERVRNVLRGVFLLPLSTGDEHVALVRAEHDTVRIMAATADLGRLAPDRLQPFDLTARILGSAIERTAPDDRAARVAVTGFDPAEIDRPAADIGGALAGQKRDLAEAALAAVIDARHPADRAGAAGFGVDELHRAGLFGDEQHGCAGRESGGPRLVIGAECRNLRLAHRCGGAGRGRTGGGCGRRLRGGFPA